MMMQEISDSTKALLEKVDWDGGTVACGEMEKEMVWHRVLGGIALGSVDSLFARDEEEALAQRDACFRVAERVCKDLGGTLPGLGCDLFWASEEQAVRMISKFIPK